MLRHWNLQPFSLSSLHVALPSPFIATGIEKRKLFTQTNVFKLFFVSLLPQ